MVCGTPGHLWLQSLEAKLVQVQLIDKNINDPDWVVLSNVVVELLWK
jgi:hypothetical protein